MMLSPNHADVPLPMPTTTPSRPPSRRDSPSSSPLPIPAPAAPVIMQLDGGELPPGFVPQSHTPVPAPGPPSLASGAHDAPGNESFAFGQGAGPVIPPVWDSFSDRGLGESGYEEKRPFGYGHGSAGGGGSPMFAGGGLPTTNGNGHRRHSSIPVPAPQIQPQQTYAAPTRPPSASVRPANASPSRDPRPLTSGQGSPQSSHASLLLSHRRSRSMQGGETPTSGARGLPGSGLNPGRAPSDRYANPNAQASADPVAGAEPTRSLRRVPSNTSMVSSARSYAKYDPKEYLDPAFFGSQEDLGGGEGGDAGASADSGAGGAGAGFVAAATTKKGKGKKKKR